MRFTVRATAVFLLTMSLLAGYAGGAAAQAPTLPYDHVHLAAPDQAVAVEWYRKNLGGQLSAEGKDRVTFGKTRFIFLKTETAKPSAGTAIDHIGFSFADVDAKMKELQAAGVKIVTPLREVPGLVKVGFIEDPWGVKIEVMQDPDLIGFHHVHLRAPDPAASLGLVQGPLRRRNGEAEGPHRRPQVRRRLGAGGQGRRHSKRRARHRPRGLARA